MTTATELIKEAKSIGDPVRARNNLWFFKTKKGQYGYGDKFMGLTVPKSRLLVKKYLSLSLSQVKKLLASPWHDIRLIGVLILVGKFGKGDEALRKQIYDLYLSSTHRINNWDLVDSSAHKIVGRYLCERPKTVLYKLAKSDLLWDRRIAVISTFYFINLKQFVDSLAIARLLLGDKEDLIHKAVGWMLREVGNRSLAAEREFLDKYADKMPRTALRYAIEKFPPALKKHYLNIKRR